MVKSAGETPFSLRSRAAERAASSPAKPAPIMTIFCDTGLSLLNGASSNPLKRAPGRSTRASRTARAPPIVQGASGCRPMARRTYSLGQGAVTECRTHQVGRLATPTFRLDTDGSASWPGQTRAQEEPGAL